MTESLADFAAENGIRYFMISFTDLFGAQRAKLVPARAIAAMQKDGAGFAGFATWLDMTPAHPDMLAKPDPASVTILPWNKEVAWVASNCIIDGEDVKQAPRNTLFRLMERNRVNGLELRTGVEAEFFLLSEETSSISDPNDVAIKPCYDQQAMMRRYDLISQLCDYMEELGWEPYQNDHEDGNGQFEMNWGYADALTTADRHSFFKFMVKSIAEMHGFRATFMPKPIEGHTGNGCHAHISLWDIGNNTNTFKDTTAELGISKKARHFVGGLIEHASAICAITNPTVNSYKRINISGTRSGASWAPSTASWSGNNRTHLIRIPDNGRLEIRLPDGAANPYLLQAALCAAGMVGIESKTDPGKPMDLNMHDVDPRAEGMKLLPANLLDALRALKDDNTLAESIGRETIDAFLKLKFAEWADYTAHFTDWEIKNALDV